MRQALETAEQVRREGQVRLATTMAEKKGIEKALIEGQAELAIAQQNFMTTLQNAGFNEEADYVKAKLAENMITLLDNEINDFQERRRSAEDYYIQVQCEVEGLTVIDVTALEVEYLELQARKNILITKRTAIVVRQAHNQTLLTKICTLVGKLERTEEEHQLIGHLARIARGDNEQKVSFERYVLAAFFNDIIDAANIRLKKMTGGRYQMSRIAQKVKGSGQSGL